MSDDGYYTDGTVSVANGSASYVGAGTAWRTVGLRAGDKFMKNGLTVRLIADPTDDTHFTGEPWPGTALSGSTYAIELLPGATRATEFLQTLISLLGSSGNMEALGGLTGGANKLAYFTGAGAMALSDLPTTARQLLAVGGAQSNQTANLGLACSVGANALTINLKQKDGSTDPTATLPVIVGMRSATLSSGLFEQRIASSALSITVPSGATLGQASAVAANLYVYLVDNAGTVELAVAGSDFGDGGRVSTTLLNTASDAADTMYSTTARSNVAFRKIGVLINTQATAGTWATAPSTARTAPFVDAESEAFKSLKDDATVSAMLTTLGITFGTYIPTHTNTTNLDGSTTSTLAYLIVGSRGLVFGTFQADATTGGSACEMGVSLPPSFPSDFTNTTQIGGTGTINNVPVRILSDATNNRATLAWTPASSVNQLGSFIFAYQVM